MRSLDFSSWQALLSTVAGLAFITLIAVGIRLLLMHTVQQRRERENRQVNERLKSLISAYKTLGGSFTGDLSVNPVHRRDLRGLDAERDAGSTDRSRRIRDAVESALSDVILLGTEGQVRLAANAAEELTAGRPVHTAELVVSLRDFIRTVLDLEPVPGDIVIPKQGPARQATAKGGKDDAAKSPGSGAGAAGVAGGAGMHGFSEGTGDPPHER